MDAGTIPNSYAKVTAHMLARDAIKHRMEAQMGIVKGQYKSTYKGEFKPKNFRRFGKLMPVFMCCQPTSLRWSPPRTTMTTPSLLTTTRFLGSKSCDYNPA